MRLLRSNGPRMKRSHAAWVCNAAPPSAAPTRAVQRESDIEWATNNLPDISDDILERSSELAARTKDELILAPLTRATTVPFRRLCHDFGCNITMSEMALARQLKKRVRHEMTRLRTFEGEPCFGLQIATNNIAEGLNAAQMAADAGAAFLDLNCGCPIYEITRRGCGAALLRKPRKLAKLVAGIVQGSPIPVTVKIRIGETSKKINVMDVVPLLERAGAAAVTIHGRTMEQRYKRPADWSIISAAAETVSIPVIGNGDLLTNFEVAHRKNSTPTHALMTGRGALVKPWIFEEARTGQELAPSAQERVEIYRRFASYMKEYFHDDALGKKRAFYFLPWHFEFFCRYREYPTDTFKSLRSDAAPLMSFREGLINEHIGETLDSLSGLERLLRCTNSAAHDRIADVLWEAKSDQVAVSNLEKLGNENLSDWEAATNVPTETQETVASG